MKIPLMYGQIRINDVDSSKDNPFKKDAQDFQINQKNLDSGSRTTNGGWTATTQINARCMANGSIGQQCSFGRK